MEGFLERYGQMEASRSSIDYFQFCGLGLEGWGFTVLRELRAVV